MTKKDVLHVINLLLMSKLTQQPSKKCLKFKQPSKSLSFSIFHLKLKLAIQKTTGWLRPGIGMISISILGEQSARQHTWYDRINE
jgi:hypothetical protein